MIRRLTRFAPWQTAKTLAAVYFGFGLILGIPVGLIMSVMPTAPGQSKTSLLFVVLVPFVYALAALIFVPLGCWIYNLAARFTGGIEVSVEPQADA